MSAFFTVQPFLFIVSCYSPLCFYLPFRRKCNFQRPTTYKTLLLSNPSLHLKIHFTRVSATILTRHSRAILRRFNALSNAATALIRTHTPIRASHVSFRSTASKMPTTAYGWGSKDGKSSLEPMTFQRRDVGPGDVSIKIDFCGVDHTDWHVLRDEWGATQFPLVAGHEIVGHVTAVGADVTKFKVGDTVGVGGMVDSCLECEACKKGLQNYCKKSAVETYNSPDTRGPEKMTMGGFSDHIVVREEFVLRIPDNLDPCAAAPLLCAGVTMYAPLHHWKATKGSKVGVVGLGGTGHLAVKLAHAMGAEVTVFTTSASKVEAAKKLGAHHVVISKDAEQMAAIKRTLNLIIDTVGVSHDLNPYLNTLDLDGTHVLVGAPETPHPPVDPFVLLFARRSLSGVLLGGIAETQEMLDFCGKHNVVSDVEVVKIDYINEAFQRMLKSDVKYRFVVDMRSMEAQ